MKQRLVIALLAALCFGAGFAARMWTEDEPAVPPPPAALGTEFASNAAKKDHHGPNAKNEPNRSRIMADIQRLRPQIDTYRARIQEIDADFDRRLVALLTSEQREKFEARQKRFAERRAKDEAREAADTGPLTDEQLFQLQQRPLWNVLWSVAIDARFDRLNKDLKFDEAQKARVRELYRERREKFIELVDSVQPPTITLSQLAPQAEKINKEPAKK